jgi:predicted dehydrogenase
MIETKTKILICGLGSIGQRHARNLIFLGYLNIFALRTRNLPLPPDLKKIKIISSFDEAKKLTPNVTFITNPTSLHTKYAIEFANIGSHLFIEKPLSDTLTGMDKLEKIVNKNKLIAMVGYNFRFHPQIIEMKKIIDKKIIGKILTVNVNMGDICQIGIQMRIIVRDIRLVLIWVEGLFLHKAMILIICIGYLVI